MRRRILSCGKRGNVQDLALVIGIALVFGMLILFGYKILFKFNEKFSNLPIATDESKASVDKLTTIYPSLFDTVFVITLVVFFIISLISAYFIDVHPIFFVFSIIVLIAILVCVSLVANANEEMIGNAIFADIIDRFPMLVWISTNIFTIAVVMGGAILISLYAKFRSEQI